MKQSKSAGAKYEELKRLVEGVPADVALTALMYLLKHGAKAVDLGLEDVIERFREAWNTPP